MMWNEILEMNFQSRNAKSKEPRMRKEKREKETKKRKKNRNREIGKVRFKTYARRKERQRSD